MYLLFEFFGWEFGIVRNAACAYAVIAEDHVFAGVGAGEMRAVRIFFQAKFVLARYALEYAQASGAVQSFRDNFAGAHGFFSALLRILLGFPDAGDARVRELRDTRSLRRSRRRGRCDGDR